LASQRPADKDRRDTVLASPAPRFRETARLGTANGSQLTRREHALAVLICSFANGGCLCDEKKTPLCANVRAKAREAMTIMRS
jgi:hypothetical protein